MATLHSCVWAGYVSCALGPIVPLLVGEEDEAEEEEEEEDDTLDVVLVEIGESDVMYHWLEVTKDDEPATDPAVTAAS